MIKIDLITGFLGSGKTTFVKRYVKHFISEGTKVGIIQNDFGAVNVDMMLLQELEGELCDIEQIAGGNTTEWKRRFKSKLIAMAMEGFQRIIVEPSGIYDVDEFFDVLHEEPLDRWYEIGNVIAIVDASLETTMSKQAEYLLASQVSRAGKVVLSRSQAATKEKINETVTRLNLALEQFQCKRKISENVFCKEWGQMDQSDFADISSCGYTDDFMTKLWFEQENAFDSLYFMNVDLSKQQLKDAVKHLFADRSCGDVFRVKGFLKDTDNQWMELNATPKEITLQPISQGQEVLIVIGEGLVEEKINAYWKDITVENHEQLE